MRDDWCRKNGGWNPGIHNHRRFSSFEDSSFTLFVDNLPRDVGPRWFRSFFSKFGIVKKSFIPYKISKRSGCRFGFITFGKRDEADMAIAKAHGIRIDNRSLFVKMASFTKNDRSGVAGPSKDVGVQNGEHQTNVWNKGFKSFSEVVKGSDNFGSVIKLDEIGNEWLLRSATAKLAPSKSLVLVQDQLANLGYLNIQVRTMGGDYLVLTFPTVEACNSVFNNGEFAWLQDWFLEIHKWDKHRVIPPSRSVWLNCFGVPLHLWNSVTFKKIGQRWGNVLEISNDTIQETSFSVGKVLISTQTLDVINQVILVENKGVQFKIRVCEEQIVVNTILKAECNCKGCKEEGELNIEEDELVNNLDMMEQLEDNRSEQGSHVEETKEEGAVDADLVNDLNKSGQMEQMADNGSRLMDNVEETKEVSAEDMLGANYGTVGTPSSALIRSNRPTEEAFGNLHVNLHAKFSNVLSGHMLNANYLQSHLDIPGPINFVGQVGNRLIVEDGGKKLVNPGANKVIAQPHSSAVNSKSRRKFKTVEEILGLTKQSSVRKKQKCAVFRSAAATVALSVSTEGIVNRNRILLNEAQAVWALDNFLGNDYTGPEEEVISKMVQMEIEDEERAALLA